MHACIHAYTHTFKHPCMHAYTHTFKHSNIHACLHICSAVITWCTHPRVTHPPQTLSRSPHGPRCPPRQSHGWSRRTHPDQPLHASTCLAGQHLATDAKATAKTWASSTTPHTRLFGAARTTWCVVVVVVFGRNGGSVIVVVVVFVFHGVCVSGSGSVCVCGCVCECESE